VVSIPLSLPDSDPDSVVGYAKLLLLLYYFPVPPKIEILPKISNSRFF
jgi:hypothetical protein